MTDRQTSLGIWLLLSAVTVVCGRSLPDNGVAQNRTLRHAYCNEDEYPVNGICCQLCPSGTHVHQHCTVTHQRGFCHSCMEGKDYTGHNNGLEQCIPCSQCRPDQVYTEDCTVKTDAECDCKPGYFCIPGEPCEACSRCSRCPEGQRVKDRCTPTRDTVCEDLLLSSLDAILPKNATTADSPAQKSRPQIDPGGTDGTNPEKDTDVDEKSEPGKGLSWIPLTLAGVSFTFIALIAFYFSTRGKEKQKDSGSEISLFAPSTIPSSNTSVQPTPVMDRSPTHITERGPEEVRLLNTEPESAHPEVVITQMAECNTQATPSHLPDSKDPDPSEDEVEENEDEESTGMCSNCAQIFPCDCQWSDFFYLLIDHIRADLFLRLVRSLRLSENVIDQIRKDNPGSTVEQNYKLLLRWREQTGNQADMGKVLQILQDMGLDGCCENIVNSLKSKKIHYNNPCKSS